jgi:threonine/homoserine/homoserine lactone efflux protein
MLVAVLGGLGVGIILSFLTGPVFFALIKTSIEKGFLSGVALSTGVLLGDLIYVVITFFGARFIPFQEKYNFITSLVGGFFLIAIGIYYTLHKPEVKCEVPESKIKFAHAGDFFNGFIMCFFNPSVLIFWLTVNGILKAVFHIDNEFDNMENVLFFGSVLATGYTLDILKAYAANKLRTKIKGRTIQIMNRIAGLVIIFFGLRLIVLALVPSLSGDHKKQGSVQIKRNPNPVDKKKEIGNRAFALVLGKS